MTSSEHQEGRRALGALEGEVLTYLWHVGQPVTPRQVLDGAELELAYTTVLTILTRLRRKGVVDREQRGRVYLYRPKLDEADYVAQAMQRQLGQASDQAAVLSSFVGTLTTKDIRLLRALLDDPA